MLRRTIRVLAIGLWAAGCGGANDRTGAGGTGGAAGGSSAGAVGTAGASAGTSGGVSGSSGGVGGTSGGAGAAGTGGSGAGGTGGSSASGGGAGTSGGAGATGGAPDDGGAGATGTGGAPSDAAPGPSFLPAGYAGTPYTTLTIPGRINACDYDRGGAGVAWCHNAGACGSGTTTGDWYPGGSPPYRAPIPANAKICSGAACDDNVGVCRMNPNKPDLIGVNMPAPASDTYLCYSTAGEWTKYTVLVEQAGTYAVGGFMAVPTGGGVNLSFSGPGNVTTGNLMLADSNPVKNCGGGEYYHCWGQRQNLATVTFAQAGVYLMTLTQTGRFNADNFTFTKM
jgi:hypothetical protein